VLPPLLAVTLSTVVLYGATAFFRPPPGPHLRLPQLPLDLGRGEPHTSPRGTFEISNSGSEDLTFKITPSCGCAALEPQAGTLDPGESRTIAIAVRLEGRNSRRNVRLTLETNDPAASVSEYYVSAFCPPLLDVAPASLDFGDIQEGIERETTLKVRLPEGSSVTSLRDVQFRSLHPSITVEPLRQTSELLELAVRLRADAPRSVLATQLELEFPGREIVTVPVRADVVGQVVVAPTTVRAGRDAQTGGFRPVIVVVRATGDCPLGDLTRIDAPDACEVALLSSRGRQATLRVQIGSEDVPAGAVITLAFEGLERQVVVPIAVDRKSDDAS
jgi:hypothetical protein